MVSFSTPRLLMSWTTCRDSLGFSRSYLRPIRRIVAGEEELSGAPAILVSVEAAAAAAAAEEEAAVAAVAATAAAAVAGLQ